MSTQVENVDKILRPHDEYAKISRLRERIFRYIKEKKNKKKNSGNIAWRHGDQRVPGKGC